MVPTGCHEDFIDVLLDCYYKLSQSPDLKPSASINCLFERLVGLCTQIPNEAVTSQVSHSHIGYNDDSTLHEWPQILSDARVVDIAPHLRQLCSDGEDQLEAYWARKVCRCQTHEEGE